MLHIGQAAGVQEADLIGFLVKYIAVLATPGPNLAAIAAIAASSGLRGALHLCAGTAVGAGVLSAALLATLSSAEAMASAHRWWQPAGNAAGAAMLMWVAFCIARRQPPASGVVPARRSDATAFAAGFLTAATNPVTGLFFASEFLGPIGGRGAALALIPPLVFVTALSFFLGASALLAKPALRPALGAWHKPIRLAAAAALVFMAGLATSRALAELGWRPSGPSLVALAAVTFLLWVAALLLAGPPSRVAPAAWRGPIRLAAAAALVLAVGFAVGGTSTRAGWAPSASLHRH